MRKRTLILVTALAAFALTVPVRAADTGNIAVSVSLQGVIEVSLDENTWSIGAIAINSNSAPSTFTATVGDTTTKLEIKGTDGAGGWTLGTRGAVNVFEVDVENPSLVLSTSYQTLDASAAPYASVPFALTYKSPASDNKSALVTQEFTITVKASAP